jgi:hypothetical protein
VIGQDIGHVIARPALVGALERHRAALDQRRLRGRDPVGRVLIAACLLVDLDQTAGVVPGVVRPLAGVFASPGLVPAPTARDRDRASRRT